MPLWFSGVDSLAMAATFLKHQFSYQFAATLSTSAITRNRLPPRIFETLNRLGLVGFYCEHGWPDGCEGVGDDDFKCEYLQADM